jgi:hypothetical protein
MHSNEGKKDRLGQLRKGEISGMVFHGDENR